MKYRTKTLLATSVAMALVALAQTAVAQDEADGVNGAELVMENNVPETARFNLADIEEGDHEIVGHFSFRRQFMGTRATPPFNDIVQFHCFEGSELRFVTFADEQLKTRLAKRLAGGHLLPVTISVNLREVRVGHDGINMSKRLTGTITDCKLHSADAVGTAAEAAGLPEAKIEQFKKSLAPDAQQGGVAVSMGTIYANSNPRRNGSGLTISGISVFNTTAQPTTINIRRVWTEQGDATQQYTANKRMPNLESWTVEAESWSDGIYEEGKSPNKTWRFEPSTPIAAGQPLTVHLEIQIDDGEALTLVRTVGVK